MAKEQSSLQAALKKADPIVRQYIAELEKRNAKRQAQIVKLETDKIERDHRIKALQQERRPYDPTLGLIGRAGDLLKKIHAPTPEQIRTEIRELEEKLGIPPEKRSQF